MSASDPKAIYAAVVAEVRRVIDAFPASRAEIASRAGMSVSTFARRLAGKHPFYVEELARLGNVLGVDPGGLILRAEFRAWALRTLGDDAAPHQIDQTVDWLVQQTAERVTAGDLA